MIVDLLKGKVESRHHHHGYDTEHHDAYLVGRDTAATTVEPVGAWKRLVVPPCHQAVLHHWLTHWAGES